MKNYLWLFLSVILFSCTDESEDFDKGSSGLEYGLNSGRSDGYNGESPVKFRFQVIGTMNLKKILLWM